jgi:MFS family permease
MQTPVLPFYVLAIGGTAADAGLVAGLLSLTALLMRPLTGWGVDAVGRRPLVLGGTACFSLANVVYEFSANVPQVLFGRVIHGIGISSYGVASNAFLADIAPPLRRAEAKGYFAVAADIGLITGPAIGFFIVGLFGYHVLFWFSVALAFSAFLISWVPRERRARTAASRRWSIKTSLIAVDALPIAWLSLCLGLGFGPHFAFLSIYAQERGVGNPGFYYTVQALALMASRTVAGRVADRYGRAFAIIPGLLFSALALVLMPLWTDLPHFMISAALFGFGFGSAQPATVALLVDRVRPEQRGVGVSTYFIGFDVGITIGSIGFGVVNQAVGFGVMWPLAAAGVLLGILGVVAHYRWQPKHGALAQPEASA